MPYSSNKPPPPPPHNRSPTKGPPKLKHESSKSLRGGGPHAENHSCKNAWKRLKINQTSYIRIDGAPQNCQSREEFDQVKRFGVNYGAAINGIKHLKDPRKDAERDKTSIYYKNPVSSIRPTPLTILPIPNFRIDANYIATPAKREVSIFNLDDNCDVDLLTDFAKECGTVESAWVCRHPKTNKHLKMAYVIFEKIASAESFVRRYEVINLLATKVECKQDPFLAILNDRYEKLANESCPLPKHLRCIDETVLTSFRAEILRENSQSRKSMSIEDVKSDIEEDIVVDVVENEGRNSKIAMYNDYVPKCPMTPPMHSFPSSFHSQMDPFGMCRPSTSKTCDVPFANQGPPSPPPPPPPGPPPLRRNSSDSHRSVSPPPPPPPPPPKEENEEKKEENVLEELPEVQKSTVLSIPLPNNNKTIECLNQNETIKKQEFVPFKIFGSNKVQPMTDPFGRTMEQCEADRKCILTEIANKKKIEIEEKAVFKVPEIPIMRRVENAHSKEENNNSNNMSGNSRKRSAKIDNDELDEAIPFKHEPPPRYSEVDPMRTKNAYQRSPNRRSHPRSDSESDNDRDRSSRHRKTDRRSRTSNSPSRGRSDGDEKTKQLLTFEMKHKKRSIKYFAADGLKRKEHVEVSRTTRVVALGKGGLEAISSDDGTTPRSRSRSVSTSSSVPTYPDSDDDKRRKYRNEKSSERKAGKSFGWETETDESDDSFGDRRQRRNGKNYRRSSRNESTKRRHQSARPSSRNRRDRQRNDSPPRRGPPKTPPMPTQQQSVFVRNKTPPPPPPTTSSSGISAYAAYTAKPTPQPHPPMMIPRFDRTQPPPCFGPVMYPGIAYPPQAYVMPPMLRPPIPTEQPKLVTTLKLSHSAQSLQSASASSSRRDTREESPEKPAESLKSRISGLFGVKSKNEETRSTPTPNSYASTPRALMAYKDTMYDDRHSSEDMDVEVSSEASSIDVRETEEEKTARLAREKEELDRKIEIIKNRIVQRCVQRTIDELNNKIVYDLKQVQLRGCLSLVDDELKSRAKAEEEKRKKEREDKARQEAERPKFQSIEDILRTVNYPKELMDAFG